MNYRKLGRSGLKVSAVSLGSWLTYGNAVEEEAARACVRTAIEGGVNLIDTADIYAKGKAEEVLGRTLKDYRRQNIVLATKVFATMSDDVNDRGLSRKHVMEGCEASLRRLQTDYVDLFQCHRHDPDTPMEEVVRAMDDLIRQGKILYWGVSCWSPAQIVEACEVARRLLAPAPISNQPPYNLLDREIEAEVVPTSRDRGLSQVVYSPLAQGLLSGKYLDGALPAGSRMADDTVNKFIKRSATDANMNKVAGLAEVARDLGVPLATLSLAWCLREPNVASVITGASKPEQVAANLAAADLELTAETLERIEAIVGEGEGA